jgi:hypothetical protein
MAVEKSDKGVSEEMNDNLSSMISDQQTGGEDAIFNETELDLSTPQQEEQPVQAEEETGGVTEEEVTEPVQRVEVTPLANWFEENHEKFENINYVKASIRGVDPTKYLIVTTPDGTGETDSEGNERRKLKVFENADVYPVLNLPGVEMRAYNNSTFEIRYLAGDGIVYKCYGVKTGLIVVACQLIDGLLIPYNIQRVKKRDEEIDIPLYTGDETSVRSKLAEEVDPEALQLLYKQSTKVIDELNTVSDAVTWLTNRQDEMYDINHLLQIDNVLINLIR